MANKKIRVGVLFGGKSAEHEVSLQSAKNIIEALDKEKYEVIPIGIDKTGKWLLQDMSDYLLNSGNPELIKLNTSNKNITLVPQGSGEVTSLVVDSPGTKVDVIFPVLHGPFGEDGSMQGFLKIANVPFVGAGVLGSAVGMDKDVMKRLLREAEVPIPKFLVARSVNELSYEDVSKILGVPVFVKPANLGSSVGVYKVKDEKEFEEALGDAFAYDTKVLIEEAIVGREIECAVLGNENPVASVPGEVIPHHEFYSYEAKYIDENGASVEIPAKVSPEVAKDIQDLAVKTFKVLGCEGLGRVDFFLKKDGTVLVNEINTIPGFTNISMYPKMWEASGVSQKELLGKLIELAIERFERENKLKTSR